MSRIRIDTLIEIVFQGRNREYGAYILRKKYLRTLIVSMLTGILIYILLAGVPLLVYYVRVFHSPDDQGFVYQVEYIPFAPDEELGMKDFARMYVPPAEETETPPVVSDSVEPPGKDDRKEIKTQVIDPEQRETDTVSMGSGGIETGQSPGQDTTLAIRIDVYPRFPGGDEARLFFLRRHVVYPKIAVDSGIQGVVTVVFIIEPNGSLSNIKIEKGIGGGCDEESLRVVAEMPQWAPGKRSGRPVRVMVRMPIIFRLPAKRGT